MQSTLLPNAAFHLRRLVHGYPILCVGLTISVGLCIAAGLMLIEVRNATFAAIVEDARLRHAANGKFVAVLDDARVPKSLQPFNSAHLVQALNDASEKSSVPLNDVAFTLDDGPGQPFLRYRASFSVTANYVSVRRFIDRIHAELLDVSLDSISCAREAIDSQALKCSVVFSAFYARAQRG